MTRLTEDLPTLDEGIMRGIRGGVELADFSIEKIGTMKQLCPKTLQYMLRRQQTPGPRGGSAMSLGHYDRMSLYDDACKLELATDMPPG